MQKKTWAGWKKLAVKAGGCLAAVSVLAAGWGGLSYGATESSVIETLTITFEAEFGEPEEVPMPEVKVQMEGSDSGRCDVEYRTQYDNWKPGKKVRAEVAVYAEDGKVFPTTLNRNKCKVTGADFVSAKALDDTTLQVKVDYRPIWEIPPRPDGPLPEREPPGRQWIMPRVIRWCFTATTRW